MILRLGALLVLLYALGFALFGVTLARPTGNNRTDAIVVLTGGPGRIERGIALMQKERAKRMLISGTDPSVTRADLQRRLGRESGRVMRCCVDLGSESVDTRSNAEEASRWMKQRGFSSLRLITSDWHMRRARFEFETNMGSRYEILPDAVTTRPRLSTLFGEYNKYLLRWITMALDV